MTRPRRPTPTNLIIALIDCRGHQDGTRRVPHRIFRFCLFHNLRDDVGLSATLKFCSHEGGGVVFGATRRSRTGDLLITNQLLCRLS